MGFIISWIVSALAIAITAYLLPGVRLSGFLAALLTAAVLGLVNAVIKPLLLLLTLPLNILTLGLFTLVINAVVILITSGLVPGFAVSGFWHALLFSLVLVLVNYLLGLIF